MRCCCGLLQTRTCVMMTTGKGAYAVFPLHSFALRRFPTGYYGRRFSTIPQSPPPREMHHHMGRRSTTKWNRSTGAIVIVAAVAGAAGYSYYSQQDGGVPKVAVPSNWNGVQDLLRRGKLDDHEELLFTNEQVQKAWDVMRDPKGKLHTLSQEERRIYVCLELIQWAMRYQTAMSSLMMDQNKLEDTRLRIQYVKRKEREENELVCSSCNQLMVYHGFCLFCYLPAACVLNYITEEWNMLVAKPPLMSLLFSKRGLIGYMKWSNCLRSKSNNGDDCNAR